MPFLLFLISVANTWGGEESLSIQNGWFVQDGKVIWGGAQHNGWWGGYRKNTGWVHEYKVRTAICRNAPGHVGPSFTEDLDKLTDAMVKYGYPGFEHNYGLWFDRRRDNHDTQKRTDADVEPPLLEQPWARSNGEAAWDGLPKYDLTKFNKWYFDRLKKFARYCDAKGTILFHNFYMQHALLETPAHYVDFPWRPVNCVQDTGMPDAIPAANAFYDVGNDTRRELHRLYIRKCLEELGDYSNVVFLISEEYTGSLSFMQFWMDTVMQWEREKGRKVKIGLVGTKDVVDAALEDPQRGPGIDVICLSYWWYDKNGALYAPEGGREVAGRYTGKLSESTSPKSLYRQIREYRLRYPNKAIIQHHNVNIEQMWAFLMGGGSMIIARMQYPDSQPPKQPWESPGIYTAPEEAPLILPTYNFIKSFLSTSLQSMSPAGIATGDNTWCLADNGKNYLVFALEGGRIDLDLSETSKTPFKANWFNPYNGDLRQAGDNKLVGGGRISLNAPNDKPWVLWLSRSE